MPFGMGAALPRILRPGSAAWSPPDAVHGTLRGWYRADSGTTDLSGFGNTLTLTGSPGAGATQNGHVSVHTESGKYLHNDAFSYGAVSGKITIAVICKITSAHAGVIAMYTDSVFNGEGLSVDGSSIAQGNSTIDATGTNLTGTSSVAASIRRLVTTKQNGGNQVLYVDGVSEGSTAAIANSPADGEVLIVGVAPGLGFVNADVWEFAVWNGVLDATDLANFDAYAVARYSL